MFALTSDTACADEILRSLNRENIERRPEMIHALVPAVVSFQIPVKLGVKLVARTAPLFWSIDNVFSNFEVGNSRSPILLICSSFSVTVVGSRGGKWI
jgi:hypothetical protein